MKRQESAMGHAATRELFDYWNALRGSRATPERADIDLAAIRSLIADMFMLEIDAAHLFPFVLSGTCVNAFACAEQKGRSFLELWSPREARNVAAILLTVIDASCPMIATAVTRPEGWQDHEIEILLLPLGRRGQERARILGLIASTTPPSWLGLLPAKNLRLRSLQAINDSVTPLNFLFDAPPQPASASAPAQPPASKRGTFRHLRVFQGGRHIS